MNNNSLLVKSLTERKSYDIIQIEKGKGNKQMTREEMEKRKEWLEDQIFYLAMKDRWNRADFDRDDRWQRELFELKKVLKKA